MRTSLRSAPADGSGRRCTLVPSILQAYPTATRHPPYRGCRHHCAGRYRPGAGRGWHRRAGTDGRNRPGGAPAQQAQAFTVKHVALVVEAVRLEDDPLPEVVEDDVEPP